MKKNIRNSRIEILRIISMLFIVISHYTVHSGIVKSNFPVGINRFIMEFGTLGNVGVILFVLITGYFMIEKDIKEILNIKKILKFILEVLSYSLGIYIILTYLGYFEFSTVNLVKCLFPLSFKVYWFATVYLIIYILSPFINRLIKSLSKKEFCLLNIILFIICSIIPTLTTQELYGNELLQLIMFYQIGAYLKLYYNKPTKVQKQHNVFLLIMVLISIIFFIITTDIIGINIFFKDSTYYLERTSPFAIIFSTCLFNIFAWGKPFTNKVINTIASSTFGIYLIHENTYLRKILWIDLINVPNYVNSNYFIFHLIGSVLVVFTICSIIALVRNLIFEELVFKSLDKLLDKIDNFIKINLKLKIK